MNNNELVEYREFIDSLKDDFGRFIAMTEKCSRTHKGRIHLKTRKFSIFLRNKLKEFRPVSLSAEKYLLNKHKKEEASNMFEGFGINE